MQYETLWRGKPSQLINLDTLFFVVVVCLLIYCLAKYIEPQPYQYVYYSWQLSYYTSTFFLLISLLLAQLAALLVLAISFLSVHFTEYWLTPERLFIKRLHFIAINIDEIELYRVYEYSIIKNLFLNLFGLGTIRIEAHDQTDPELFMRGLHNAEEVTELLRSHVEEVRERKGIRDLNIHSK